MYEILSLLLGVAIVWSLIQLFFPIVKITDDLPEHVQATNNLYMIKIRPELDNWEGVLAQELFESKFKRNPFNLVPLLFGSGDMERSMELMGHEITIQFLRPEEQHLARLRRADSLRTYYDVFDGWAIDVIYECMLEEIPFAQEWIADNINMITDLERKRYE
jgi:hypothetical protein